MIAQHPGLTHSHTSPDPGSANLGSSDDQLAPGGEVRYFAVCHPTPDFDSKK